MKIEGRLLYAYILQGTFLLAVMLFTFMTMDSPVISIGEKQYSLLGILTDRNVLIKCRQAMINDRFIAVYGFDSMKWFAILLPVICALPVLHVYDSIDDNTRHFMLIRMSKTKYCLIHFTAAFITGFAVVVCGITLYALITYAVLPSRSTVNAVGDLTGYYGSTAWERFLSLAKKVSNTATAGGLMGCVVLIIYHLVRDRFLTVTTPMMLMYISDKLYILHDKKRFENFDMITGPRPDKICFLFPSNLGNMYYMLQTECDVSYLWFFAGTAGLLILLFVIYCKIYKGSVGK